MTNDTTLEQAIEFLSHDLRFQRIVTEFASRRESAISALSDYKTDTEMRKSAAEVTVYTEILDLFNLPLGTPIPKPDSNGND